MSPQAVAKAQATIDKRQNEIDAKTKERLELAEDKEKAGPTICIGFTFN